MTEDSIVRDHDFYPVIDYSSLHLAGLIRAHVLMWTSCSGALGRYWNLMEVEPNMKRLSHWGGVNGRRVLG